MKPLLEAKNLRKHFKENLAVDDISLRVSQGECLALLGPNGAGKTTTVEMLEGLQTSDHGKIQLFGEILNKKTRPKLMEKVGVMLQETNLYKKLTVLETVELFRSFFPKGFTPEQAIAMVELGDKSQSRLEHLSGGQKQRVYLACALINQPSLLFLDEPTTGLDPQSRRMIWDLLEGQKRNGLGVLLTTHYMDEAQALADRVAIVDHGRIIAEGTSNQLIEKFCGEQILSFAFESFDESMTPKLTQALPWFDKVKKVENHYEVVAQNLVHAVSELSQTAKNLSLDLAGVEMRKSTLEDVFLSITGRSIRDA